MVALGLDAGQVEATVNFLHRADLRRQGLYDFGDVPTPSPWEILDKKITSAAPDARFLREDLQLILGPNSVHWDQVRVELAAGRITNQVMKRRTRTEYHLAVASSVQAYDVAFAYFAWKWTQLTDTTHAVGDWLVFDMDDGLLRRAETRALAVQWAIRIFGGRVLRRHTYGPGAYDYYIGRRGEDCGVNVFIERTANAVRSGWDIHQQPLYPYAARPAEFVERPELPDTTSTKE